MNRPPTILDVARESKVSPKTVSRVINGSPSVSAETAQRVNDVIDAMGFHPNQNARSLRPGQRSCLVGLVIGDFANPFYARLAAGVEEVARSQGYLVLMSSSEEDERREHDVVVALCRRRVDGMLIVPTASDHHYLSSEIGAGTPFVFVDRPVNEPLSDTVVIDNRDGARRGVTQLVEKGHQRIAMIGDNPELYTARERRAGYADALLAANLQVDEELIRMGAHDPEAAELIALDLLRLQNPPSAFFAANNRICAGVLRAVARTKARPDVLGFDDLEMLGSPLVHLTLLRYDPADLGREAARLLFDRLNGAADATSREVHVTPELVDYDGS